MRPGKWAGRMTSRRDQTASVLLTVEAAADRLSTSPRFIRRLIAERRIEFVKVGRHVRISESVLTDFIDAGRVKPLTAASTQRKRQELRNGEPRWTPTFRQRPQT
jgi:excisionase family DNA binding protein